MDEPSSESGGKVTEVHTGKQSTKKRTRKGNKTAAETTAATGKDAETLTDDVVDVNDGLTGRERSFVWDHFGKLPRVKGQKRRAKCNYCPKTYCCESKANGTSSMKAHLESGCKKYPLRNLDKKQKTLGFQPAVGTNDGEANRNLVAVAFNVDACKNALAEMIIIDELPFRFVEGEGFKRFMHVVQPRWTRIPSRITIAKECLKVFTREKKALKSALRGQRVCLTTDTWTSLQNLNYMCLTAHFIDRDWKLHKKIINFCVVPNHKGETLGKKIERCLLEWGIDKFLTLTVDNASSNNGIVDFLKRKTKSRKTTILEHDFLHVRCCAHILNLVVCEGVKEIEVSIARVRNIVRYVRSSPSRMLKFKSYVEKEKIKSKLQPCLDVPTRWNYTYFMLERALMFQTAFERLEDDEPQLFRLSIREDEIGEVDEPEDVVGDEVVAGGVTLDDEDFDDVVVEDVVFKSKESGKGKGKGRGRGKAKARKETLGPPTSDDWKNASLYVKFLKLFYDATLKFSGSKYVTCNGFFIEMMLIRNAIKTLCVGEDEKLAALANGMRAKFDKYWGKIDKINWLLLAANVLDPRYKLKYIEMNFVLDYGKKTAEVLLDKLKNQMTRLYEWYENNDTSKKGQTQNVESSSRGLDVVRDDLHLDMRQNMLSQFQMFLEEENDLVSKSELEKYWMEGCENDNKDFDVLKWWESNSDRYKILSQIARDVLSIPVSTVASESAFSTGGRILDPFRSNLSPKTVEALICAQNWLRSPMEICIRDQLDELEELEEGLSDAGSVVLDD